MSDIEQANTEAEEFIGQVSSDQTLLDWFAGGALVGILREDAGGIFKMEETALRAYRMADAMMIARRNNMAENDPDEYDPDELRECHICGDWRQCHLREKGVRS